MLAVEKNIAQAATRDPAAGSRPHPRVVGEGRFGHLGGTASPATVPLLPGDVVGWAGPGAQARPVAANGDGAQGCGHANASRSEEHTSELQSLRHLVCRLLLEKK